MKNWDEVKQASTDQILSWAEGQEWARAMAECGQDAEWHAEGDVWTHAARLLYGKKIAPSWMVEECRHDSGEDIRKLVDEGDPVA